MRGIPELAAVRTWCGVAASSVPDEDLQQILDAELDEQARTLRVPADTEEAEADYPPALVRALLRRVQRQIAVRPLPLGILGDTTGEYGAAYVRSWDPEIRRLEDPYRIPVVA